MEKDEVTALAKQADMNLLDLARQKKISKQLEYVGEFLEFFEEFKKDLALYERFGKQVDEVIALLGENKVELRILRDIQEIACMKQVTNSSLAKRLGKLQQQIDELKARDEVQK